MKDNVLNLDAPITLIPNFLAPATADQAFATLLAELPWERRTTSAYGKNIPVPRMEVWVADHPYTYSGRTYQPELWTPTLLKIRGEIEVVTGTKFNSVLLNLYESGSDSVGWHADDEPEMSHDHPIASLSLGGTRGFQIREGRNGTVQTIDLGHGDLLIMHAGMQRNWQHRLRRTTKFCEPRINLTFRWMNFTL